MPATAEVLPEIAEAVNGRCKILVDGGIRTGVDVFKALALGADAVLIARPFVNAIYGAGAEGVQVYVDKLAGKLADRFQRGAGALAGGRVRAAQRVQMDAAGEHAQRGGVVRLHAREKLLHIVAAADLQLAGELADTMSMCGAHSLAEITRNMVRV